MDKRCPRKLNKYPDSWCPLAVLKLKGIRNSNKVLTEEEEYNLPGCNYAIADQTSNYCFFKYTSNKLNDSPLSVSEISSILMIPVDEVKKIEKQALLKMQHKDFIKDIEKNRDSEPIFKDSPDFDEYYTT